MGGMRFGIPLFKSFTSKVTQAFHVSSKWQMHSEIVSLQQRTLPMHLSLLTITNIREMLERCKQETDMNELLLSSGMINSIQWAPQITDMKAGSLNFHNFNLNLGSLFSGITSQLLSVICRNHQ